MYVPGLYAELRRKEVDISVKKVDISVKKVDISVKIKIYVTNILYN